MQMHIQPVISSAAAVAEHESMLTAVRAELQQAQQQLLLAQQGSMTAVLKAADDQRKAGLNRLADQEQQETQSALQEQNDELQIQVNHQTRRLMESHHELLEALQR